MNSASSFVLDTVVRLVMSDSSSRERRTSTKNYVHVILVSNLLRLCSEIGPIRAQSRETASELMDMIWNDALSSVNHPLIPLCQCHLIAFDQD